jgi:hypothetical protein
LRAAPHRDPIAWLAADLKEKAPMLRRGAIAIVDSPAASRIDSARERAIDSRLRALVAQINSVKTREDRIVLAMFPTPTRKTFAQFAAALDCKPHLRYFALALIGRQRTAAAFRAGRDARRHSGGRIFTRFMLAGFATHRALALLGVDTFEGYPYLAFCFWKRPGVRLPPKRERGALAARLKILDEVISHAGIGALPPPTSIDFADAAALATSAAAARISGSIFSISHPAEGRLLVALPRPA